MSGAGLSPRDAFVHGGSKIAIICMQLGTSGMPSVQTESHLQANVPAVQSCQACLHTHVHIQWTMIDAAATATASENHVKYAAAPRLHSILASLGTMAVPVGCWTAFSTCTRCDNAPSEARGTDGPLNSRRCQ